MPIKTGKNPWAGVDIKFDGGNINYIFRTKLEADQQSAFGQTVLDANTKAESLGIAVIGATVPKPHKVSILVGVTVGGKSVLARTSSFASDNKIDSLLGKIGSRVQYGKRVGSISATAKTDLYYVELNGMKYGWRRAKQSTGKPTSAQLKDVGVIEGGDQLVGVILGASFPKPPKAKIELAGGTSYGTFIDPDNFKGDVATTWTKTSKGKFSYAHLAEIIGKESTTASDPSKAESEAK